MNSLSVAKSWETLPRWLRGLVVVTCIIGLLKFLGNSGGDSYSTPQPSPALIEQSARPLHDGVRTAPPTASASPLARKTHSPDRDEAYVLACKSIEDYKRFAPIYTTKSDTVMLVRRAVNSGQCTDLNDRAGFIGLKQPHHYYRVDHVEKNGFACLWVSNASPGCLWTPTENLHYIGRSPQLSEDQFRDVRTLRETEDEMRKVSGDYLSRAQIIKHRQGDRQEEARLRSLSKLADQQADEIEEQIARIEPASTAGAR